MKNVKEGVYSKAIATVVFLVVLIAKLSVLGSHQFQTLLEKVCAMWKAVPPIFILTAGLAYYINSQQSDPEIPKLPETFWGPKEKIGKEDTSIREFKIDISQKIIDDLHERLDKYFNTANLRPKISPLEDAEWTYGLNFQYLQNVLRYWRDNYNWKKRQELLNKYPQFKTNIQGLDIHFYRVKPTLPKNKKIKVLPLLMVHGWPGSVVEFQKIIPMLTTPRADKDFVFEIIAPSLPGYGFSDPAVRPGLGATQIAVVFKNLMARLGYNEFYTQGGDWGSIITSNLATLFPEKVIGAHLNMCGINTPSSLFWTLLGTYLPSVVVDKEHASRMYPMSHHFSRLLEESGYFHLQATKPDTIGSALSDTPAGLAVYILEKFSTWTNPKYRFRADGGLLEKFKMDELLDNLMLYWVTNSITTSQRLYAESFSKAHLALNMDRVPSHKPTACAMFPNELVYQSESLLKSKYRNLIQFNHLPRGGHFAAMEEPKLLADDVYSFVEKVKNLSKSKE
ncbi:juvenile hormone epoxide hydrolase 1-like [Leptopilina boulardi]|uniref:juvenile hormone epoxide hydrolase 1-like n=1 Tax=Leptopilina boulardi TaxID=63433 RepID=UPI0021F60C8C|nr:juvenile hormone epoxide hydrolase 1-like [Leptopilina boulardi]